MSDDNSLPNRLGNTTGWTRRSFRCRAVMTNGEDYSKITKVLLDTRAAANFIHQQRACANFAITYDTHHGGHGFYRHRRQDCDLFGESMPHFYLAGVVGFAQAYVTEESEDQFLIGVPGLTEFRARMDFTSGTDRDTVVTVGPGDPCISGRHERYIVAPETEHDSPRIIKLDTQHENQEAHRLGPGLLIRTSHRRN